MCLLFCFVLDGQSARLLDDSTDSLAPDFFCGNLSGMAGLVLGPDFGVEV
jgi:hypothetical protein